MVWPGQLHSISEKIILVLKQMDGPTEAGVWKVWTALNSCSDAKVNFRTSTSPFMGQAGR